MITVAGVTPSLDITYLVSELRLGQIHRPSEVVRCAGGKPLNLARAATTLGADVAVVAVLGGATGDALLVALTEAGVRVIAVPTAAETRTCVSIASRATGTLTEVYEYAAPIPAQVWENFRAALAATVARRPGWLAIAGGPPRELPGTALGELVRWAAAAGLRVAVDTHGPALPEAVAARPDLVKINRHEAADLLGRPLDTDLAALAAEIRGRGAGAVVLTDAAAGALLLDDTGCWHASLPDVHGAFGVGSGDCFLGALLAEVDRGAARLDALAAAVAAGAANALLPGPGRLEAATVADLRGRVRIEGG